MNIIPAERIKYIRQKLYEDDTVNIKILSEELGVSSETIRRDIEVLEKEGFAERTHGGATLARDYKEDLPYSLRKISMDEEKKNIANKVLKIIPDKASIILDTGTTVYTALKMLDLYRESLTIVTNGNTFPETVSTSQNTYISTGGVLRNHSCSFVGEETLKSIRQFNVDYSIFSCKGLSLSNGVTDSNLEEASIKKAMMKQSEIKILLLDHTKFGKTSFVNVVGLETLDIVVTDKKPSDEWVDVLKQNDVKLIY